LKIGFPTSLMQIAKESKHSNILANLKQDKITSEFSTEYEVETSIFETSIFGI
jgi:hypothetical protein